MANNFKIVFVRHGESVWNVENIFTGWHDVELSENGKAEAVEAGKMLKAAGFKFDIVFTSVLKRAIRTAWTALMESDNYSMPIINTWRLNERHYGGLQGLNKADTAAKFGDDQVKIWRRSYDVPPPQVDKSDPRHPSNDPKYKNVSPDALPGAESLALTVDRVLPFWHDAIAPCVMAGRNVMVAAHGNSLRAICKYLEGMSEKEVLEFNIPTGVPLVYELDGNLNFVKKYYLMDPDEVAKKVAAVANQGAAKPAAAPSMKKSTLPDDVLKELKATATAMCAPGKGFLASDESAGPWLRAGHAEAKKIPDTYENRIAYRKLCFTAPNLSDNISGIILHWETLMHEEENIADLIKANGMIAGIKLDKAYNKKGMWGTKVGPLGHPEVSTLGLDDLQERCAQAYAKGARFAKWRNVLQLDKEKGLPSAVSIKDATETLARYAAICQSERLVPIVEPEIVPNGTHDINYCAMMTEKVLTAQYAALALHKVYLEGTVLKPNMVKGGINGPRASSEEIARLTSQALLRTVPKAVPGIFFLSGETPLDEDNEEAATINLMTMNKMYKSKMPWLVSFSYGKALQKTAIVTWLGKQENVAAAQKALKARAAANTDAVKGTYVPGTCASVGTDGNVKQAAGPY